MKTSKIALYVILLPVTVIIVASILFLATFDANRYKQELVDRVKESSGRSLTFEGDANLMLYPDFGMRLGAMQFSNAPGFGDKPMISVDEVSISVDVQSVLMLQPRISQLILSELHIDLQKNKKGITNWDDLKPKKTLTKKAPPKENNTAKEKPKTIEKKNANEFEIVGAFDGVNIVNAQVSWRDETTGEAFNLDDLDFTTGKITPTEPFPLSLQLKMRQKNAIKAQINLDADVFFDYKKQHLSVNGLSFKLATEGELLPVERAKATITGDVALDLEKQLLNVPTLQLNLETQGGVLEQSAMTMAGEFSMALAQQQINIANLDVTADISDQSMPKGQLNALLQAQQFALNLNQRKVDLKQLQLMINSMALNGQIQVKDYAQPSVSFELASKNINLDEFLGLNNKAENASTNSEETQQASEATAEDIEISLPMQLLRDIELDGSMSIGHLKVMNIVTRNNQLNIKAQNGLVEIKPLGLDLYKGSLTNNLVIDVRQELPQYTINTQLKNVQIGDLLIDFMQLDKIRGAANIGINLKTQGRWLKNIKKNLNGDVSLRFADGALKGFNLRHMIDVAKASLSNSKKPQENIQETDFTELSLSGVVKNGVFYSDDLSLKAPLIRVGGEGEVDLNNNTVDYTVNAKVIASLEGQTGEGLDASGLLIPVRIFGPFSKIETDILLDNMLRQQAAKKLAETKAALKAKTDKLVAEQKAALKLKQQRLKAEAAQTLAAQKLMAEAALKKEQDAAKAAFKKEQDEIAAQKKKLADELKAKQKSAADKAKQKAQEALEDKLKGFLK